jgi:ABC-type sugar transport system substrate-binding protein
MKRLSVTLVTVVLLAAVLLSACGKPTPAPTTQAPPTQAPATQAPPTQAPEAKKEIIAVCLPALDNPLMLELSDAFVKAFGDEYDVRVASADGNPNTQATQIENFTTMGAKFMFVMTVEASSLLPKLEAA